MLSRSGCRFTGYEDPTQHDAPAATTAATTAARYQPGAWERAGDALRVHHGDQIGTSRFMTNASAETARRAVFTAFGELVMADDGHGQPPAASRYGYAGAWGYETDLDDAGEPDLPSLPFIHVGERWYDPSSGRFLQRDPIGIEGGLNVFETSQTTRAWQSIRSGAIAGSSMRLDTKESSTEMATLGIGDSITRCEFPVGVRGGIGRRT